MPPQNNQPAEKDADSRTKGAFPLKSVVIIAAIMLLEGGGLAFYMAYTDPADANAGPATTSAKAEQEEVGEVVILEDRFTNMRSGRLYMYDVRICVEINEDGVKDAEEKLKKRAGYVHDSIRIAFAQADPKYLEEPELQTMKRKVHEILDGVLGEDAVRSVLFAKYHPYRGQ